MKAIRVHEFGGPEVLKLEDCQEPHPGPKQVLIRVKAAGVNPYDTYMRSGAYGARNPSLPYTPGSDAAGIIERVGPEASQLTIGERVYTTGTISGAYAELALCDCEHVHKLPEAASFSQGAAIYVPYATAYRSLFQLARSQRSETVLIHGASGGVGIAAIQLARSAGLIVIGTAGTEKGLELVKAMGAHHAVNHKVPDYHKEILEISGGRGVDVILEMLANVNLGQDLKLLAQRGRVVVVGSRGNVEITPRDLMSREATIIGMFLWGVSKPEQAEIHTALQTALGTGSLHPFIGCTLPLKDAAEAHRRLMEPGALGKIVLLP